MDHSPRPVVADMLFGLAVGETDGVFGDFGSEAVVGTKGFLHGIRVSVWIIRQRNISEYIPCNSDNGRAKFARRPERTATVHTGCCDSSRILYRRAFCL
jgi:hypothetical protein